MPPIMTQIIQKLRRLVSSNPGQQHTCQVVLDISGGFLISNGAPGNIQDKLERSIQQAHIFSDYSRIQHDAVTTR